jgi:hypothetical protein
VLGPDNTATGASAALSWLANWATPCQVALYDRPLGSLTTPIRSSSTVGSKVPAGRRVGFDPKVMRRVVPPEQGK